MENTARPRTDMASEAHRLWRSSEASLDRLPGVEAEEGEQDGFPIFRVRILNESGVKALGKPRGNYVTLELERFYSRGEEPFPRAVGALAALVRERLGGRGGLTLIVGLGNGEITPDALGPAAAREVFPTRHLMRGGHPLFRDCAEVAVCTPGVMGTSGVETAAQVRALCRELRPSRVIVVDALAGAEPGRLCRTVQLTDSGIAPGSGVGNDRAPLSADTLGVPVLALGVPTVIDAACLGDAPGLRGMFVTPRDIDATVRRAGRLLAYALDLALHPDLTVEDVTALID